ncbi:PadR family transcriptional regulator [Priestia flexa]|uniref:PadR family transcriptional regulator n=1 Tax=Priestia flexa TaxID=86664 RepID=UPI0012947B5F|nr:PadR family transcriptional regulator [Priestia flexa]WEZ06763.1 PadR family transcriptional regulator [Priestia flexa]
MLREFFLGSIKIHILYHASVEPIYGSYMIEELHSHGYDISPGTIYPTLHHLEKDGLLIKEERIVKGKIRKYYTITEKGQEVLQGAKEQIRELAREVLTEGEDTT